MRPSRPERSAGRDVYPATKSKNRFPTRRALGIAGVALAVALVGGVTGFAYLLSLLPPAHYASGTREPASPVATSESLEWTHFAGDAAATQYSGLSEISPANVGRLRLAWTYRTGEAERRGTDLKTSSFGNTPIMAAGSLIVCTPWARVIALDPAAGQERWSFDPGMTMRQPPGHRFTCRGVAAWRDPLAPEGEPCAERLIVGTNDLRVIALDAVTGTRCPRFGDNGEVRVKPEADLRFPGEVQFNGPPAVVGDVVVLGSTVSDHGPAHSPSGAVRAFDLRTGEPRWQFEPVPRMPSDPAQASWDNGSASRHGSANVWADMSADEERGVLYLATSSPSPDHDGRDRSGDNRYSDSVVALEAASGQVLWSFQVVHHDIWDYDLPSAPLLTTLELEDGPRDVVIQLTKQGLVFVLDRETGDPVFSVEERPVAQSDIPGEHSAETQPFPSTMPWLMGLGAGSDGISAADAWGFTFWDRGACRTGMERRRALGLYGPPSRDGTLVYPWLSGGSNLGMRAYDPGRRLLIVNLIRTAGILEWPVARTPEALEAGSASTLLLSPLGAPCIAPPWGELVALDVERQEVLWRVPLGTTEKLGLPLKLKFGTPSRGGPLVTASGLVFIGGTMDDALRAFATDSGRELWRVTLPAGGQATPMTYMAEGRQHVVIAAGGHAWMGTTPGDYVVAYALPD
ncbi:MAG: pyrroloquinoline quinone-dependent dehydrogenase [Woeseia sp.]